MPIEADALLTLAARLLAAEGAGEGEWRTASRLAFDAVAHRVALHFAVDPATFSGSPRALHDALRQSLAPDPPAFLILARRHWNTLWLASLRAEKALDEPVSEADAKLSMALAGTILRAAGGGRR